MSSIIDIPLTQLRVSPHNVRTSPEDVKNDETNLKTLTSNIETYGLLNPLTVCQTKRGYDILAGQRRFQAVQQLGWTEVPCKVVVCKDAEQAALISLAENLQRLPMTIKDKCHTLSRLYNLHDQNVDEVCKMTNLSDVTIKRYVRLNDTLASSLHDQFDEAGAGKLTLGVANMLAQTVQDEKKQQEVYDNIKGLATNKQKKDVIKAIEENPEADIEDLVQEVQQREHDKKRNSKIKSKPWTLDENKEPIKIPTRLYGSILDLIRENE